MRWPRGGRCGAAWLGVRAQTEDHKRTQIQTGQEKEEEVEKNIGEQ